MIQLESVCFAYEGYTALQNVSLHIAKGETVVLQGANGCGKSTLLKLINGLVFPQQGRYWFAGKEITEHALKDSLFSRTFHQRIGFIFQNADVQLFCGSVEEEIGFGPGQMGLSQAEIARRTVDVMKLLEISHLKARAPYQLSGGEKRKVAIACILSMNPDVLVLDEPLAGLDQKSQVWLVSFLQQLQAAGKTMLLSTHNEALAKCLADRLVYMGEDHTIESVVLNAYKQSPASKSKRRRCGYGGMLMSGGGKAPSDKLRSSMRS